VLGGVSPTDQIVINPADSLEDGQQVDVVQPPANLQQPGQPSPSQQKGGAS
jgi:hypothetical protein